MSEFLENRFAIKRITKATDEDYLKALKIYNDTTPMDIKTSTNEMSAWINSKNTDNSFELLIFALYLDANIIGLAMASYIQRQRVVVYDYIALEDHYRVNAVFFAYINLIQNYISLRGLEVDFFVNEVSNKFNGEGVDKESRLFRKLICLEGFGRIQADYYTVPLGLDNFESSFEAFLHIKASGTIKKISRETFLNIVHAIYYEYYMEWYSAFMPKDDLECYKQKIDNAFSIVSKQFQDKEMLNIEYTDCPLSGSLKTEKTYGYLPSTKASAYSRYPLVIIILLISPIVIVWGYNEILKLLDIPLSSVNSTIGGVFGAMLASITAYSVSRRKI